MIRNEQTKEAAMLGSYDQYFTRDCKDAERFAGKIEELVVNKK